MRTARKTRVVETAEFGSETRSTRRIKNENRCHTVNYDYFEILEQYEVTVAAENTQFVALVPLPETGEIDAAWVLCHEHPIRANLLHRTYEKGFEAAKIMSKFGVIKKTKMRNKLLIKIADYVDMDLLYLYKPRDDGGLVN